MIDAGGDDLATSREADGAEDVTLMARMAAGEQEALGLLYDRWAQRAYGVAAGIVPTADLAEDVLEDVFWQLWQRAGSFMPERGPVGDWLLALTRRRASEFARPDVRAPAPDNGAGGRASGPNSAAGAPRAGAEANGAKAVAAPRAVLNRGRSAGVRSRLLARAEHDLQGAAKRRVAAALQRQRAAEPAASPPVREATVSKPAATPAGAGPAVAGPAATERRLWEPLPREARLWPYAVAVALLAVAAAAGALTARMWPGQAGVSRETFLAQQAEIVDLSTHLDSLERLLRERERALHAIAAPAVRVINLTNRGAAGRPLGRMFWDPGTRRWSLFIYDLRPPRPDHVYHLWAVAGERRASIGAFRTAADGTGFAEGRHDMWAGEFRAVSVTEEPAGGVGGPSGPVVLAGGVQ